MNSSEKAGSCWSTRLMVPLSMRTIVAASKEVAVAEHTRCPARQASPKKSPPSNIATTASLPCLDTTVSLTQPFTI